MKKKIVAMALSAVLGLSLFGGVAQARVEPNCPHPNMTILEERTFKGYERVSGLFHNEVYLTVRQCDVCSRRVNDYEYVPVDHDFHKDANGNWVCICGEVDESNHY